jgi:hypothetical protein
LGCEHGKGNIWIPSVDWTSRFQLQLLKKRYGGWKPLPNVGQEDRISMITLLDKESVSAGLYQLHGSFKAVGLQRLQLADDR